MEAHALIVDDSRTVRVRVRRLLEGADGASFSVTEAADGGEALQLLQATPRDRLPDVILLDRNMPRVSGDACIRILKSDPVWKTIPVIFLTAQANKAELVKGLSLLGGDDYLSKPFDAGEMLARVKALVRLKKAEDAQRRAYADLEAANDKLAEAFAHIASSIRYASRIQRSVLPPDELVRTVCPDSVILWEPRDMVGGDIYWAAHWGDGLLLALGDCTGHGVPGAFVTMIATCIFERLMAEVPPGRVDTLLERMHRLIRSTLKQDVAGGESDDGMELGLCHLSADLSRLTFAGAAISLFTAADGKPLEETKGVKRGLGYRKTAADQAYPATEVALAPGSRFYMMTDGLIDQVGGNPRRTLGKKRVLEVLNGAADRPMAEHKDLLMQALLAHQGQEPRRDDVSMIGVRIGTVPGTSGGMA